MRQTVHCPAKMDLFSAMCCRIILTDSASTTTIDSSPNHQSASLFFVVHPLPFVISLMALFLFTLPWPFLLLEYDPILDIVLSGWIAKHLSPGFGQILIFNRITNSFGNLDDIFWFQWGPKKTREIKKYSYEIKKTKQKLVKSIYLPLTASSISTSVFQFSLFTANMSVIFLCLCLSFFSMIFLWSQSGCWILGTGLGIPCKKKSKSISRKKKCQPAGTKKTKTISRKNNFKIQNK